MDTTIGVQYHLVDSMPGAKTILVVDDDAAFIDATAAALSGGGYRVLEANSDHQALAIISALRGEIDLVLLDLDLPERGGLDTLIDMRHIAPNVPVIAMTGAMSKPVLDVTRYLGASQCLRKPITPEWSMKIDAVLRGTDVPLADAAPVN